ncbi:MAG: 30S ribosomal protein S1, partial [Clostridia bacterium]|nr:30S ribosomal protein S1 [Clostridia bacterium]
GKPVCFKVISIEPIDDTYRVILSRKRAQIECRSFYLSSLRAGDIIPATVTHLDRFGAFVDVGCGIASLLSIDCISVSRISHPSDRLFSGQRLEVIVKSNDTETGRIYVTLKELLGTWEENANEFCVGQTVSGIVRSIESYGVFVELAPNLAGLAELKEENPLFNSIEVGDAVSVYIKSILPDRMKIKLILIDCNTYKAKPTPLRYYIDAKQTRHLDTWHYSPTQCTKLVETVFE